MGRIKSFQERGSFSQTWKDRLPRVIAILSSRASQPIAQPKTGASHSTFFLSFVSVDLPLSFRAFQITPAVVPISVCIRGNSSPFDLSRFDITETSGKTTLRSRSGVIRVHTSVSNKWWRYRPRRFPTPESQRISRKVGDARRSGNLPVPRPFGNGKAKKSDRIAR